MSKMSLKLTDEPLVGHAGLISIGEMLRIAAIDETCLHRESMAKPIKDRDILRTMCGLLTLGRTDFDHIRPFREDEFFARSLGLRHVPSEATLRQRFQQLSEDQRVLDALPGCSLRMWSKLGFKPRVIERDKRKWVRVDVDPTILDCSDAPKREGVAFAHNNVLGYQLVCAFLEGGVDFLKEVQKRAKKLTRTWLLNILDCAFDSADVIIKHNLRKENVRGWLETTKAHGVAHCPRPGKTVWRGSITREVKDVGPVRLVFEVAERTDMHGQLLLTPEIAVFSVWTSLDLPEKDVLRLYRDRGTCEQYFTELKSELDLERPPSGRFKANKSATTGRAGGMRMPPRRGLGPSGLFYLVGLV